MDFKVIATTKHPEGVSYDAHLIKPRKKLVRGDVLPTDEEALANLMMKLGALVRG